MIKFLSYILGRVIIKISGDTAYEILNIAAKNSVQIKHIRWEKGNVIGTISPNDFKKLRILKRGSKGKIKIIKKIGIPFLLSGYKNRYGITIGIFLFFFILKFMSGIIWNVEVVGNKNISKNEILKSCKEIGIYEGVYAKNINTHSLPERLLIKNKRLAWASLNIENSLLSVNVTEIKEKKKENQASNLIASADGIIEKIDITSGNVLVKIGQRVLKGDLLVSGIIEKADSTDFVASKGSIFAQRNVTFNYKENILQTVETLENKTIMQKKIKLFNLKIPLTFFNTDNAKKISSKEKQLNIFDKNLPVYLYCDNYKKKIKNKVSYTKDELLNIIDKKNKADIKKLDAVSVNKISESIDFTEGELTVRITYSVLSDIVQKEQLIHNTDN